MVWRCSRKDYEAGKGAVNRSRLKRLVEDGGVPGVLGYVNDRPVAWCAVAPRSTYGFLSRSRVLAPIDDEPVWSISCLFVEREYRQKGLSSKMIEAAVGIAADRGATVVEGYPVEPRADRAPDAFVWTGLPGSFRKAGFTEVARRSETRPIMRLVVRGAQ